MSTIKHADGRQSRYFTFDTSYLKQEVYKHSQLGGNPGLVVMGGEVVGSYTCTGY